MRWGKKNGWKWTGFYLTTQGFCSLCRCVAITPGRRALSTCFKLLHSGSPKSPQLFFCHEIFSFTWVYFKKYPIKKDLLLGECYFTLTKPGTKKPPPIFCSQFDTAGWHLKIGKPKLADAICYRIVHDSYKIVIDGDSMRKKKGIMD